MSKNIEDTILIEQRLTRLETKLDDVISNHLAHISEDIKTCKDSIGNINVKLAKWGGIIIGVGTILQVIVNNYFK